MKKVKVFAIGKLPRFLQDASREYERRVNKYCSLEIQEKEIRGISSEKVQQEKENEWLREKLLEHRDFLSIGLDLSGKAVKSEEFSELIQEAMENSRGMVLVIGGSQGLSAETLSLVTRKISFSKMTFPHALFRVMLLEQLYRAFTILKNEPYHK